MAWARTSRHERGYGKAHERMRAHLLATVILCEECTRQGLIEPGVIADHIIPKARGGTDARGNYQLLCQRHSDEKTAADKGHGWRAIKQGVGADGRPTDPQHPWNRR